MEDRNAMPTEAMIRKAGQVAIDDLIDRAILDIGSDDDIADYLTRIVDACVSAALAHPGHVREIAIKPTPEMIEAFAFSFWKVNVVSKLEANRQELEAALSAALAEPRDEERYAERLATSLWEKHWKEDAPDWKPLSGDLIGILTQIDNMTAGLSRLSPFPSIPEEKGGTAQVDKPVICIGRHTINRLMAGESVEIDAAIMIPASDLSEPNEDGESGEHQEVLDAIAAHNSGEDE